MSAPLNIHASTVAWDGRAVVIVGTSGSGKSALALALMAWGCSLVADDRTVLSREGDRLIASCPPALLGLIEARGTAILPAVPVLQARVVLAVDLGLRTSDRLPGDHRMEWLGLSVPAFHNSAQGHFPAAILQYLKIAPQNPLPP
jgi:HPr kinase/phosphorylase